MAAVDDAVTPAEPEDESDGLPRWDLTPLFPSVAGPEVRAAEERFGTAVAELKALYDRHDVRSGDMPSGTPGDADEATVVVFEEVLAATNEVLERFSRLEAFAYLHVSSDATNEPAQQLLSRLQTIEADLTVLRTRFDAWVARLGPEVLIPASQAARDHAWPLRKAARRAAHQMTEVEEALAAELGITGSTAWSRLYEDLTAGITATVRSPDGTTETLPIFAVRGLATSPDPVRREAAFDAELTAWEAHATPIGAALNAIKGEALALNRRRGWDDPLDPVLAANAVDRATLDALNAAVDDALDHWRRYLTTKARLLGKQQCAFWDLFAPVGTVQAREWDDAVDIVQEAFAGYSPGLVDLARQALAESWVDAGPRTGKVGGGFCMNVGDGASRILMNYDGSIDSIHTLAHELGHAYHNHTLRARTPLQRATPMPLAETASIFCETILTDQAVAEATGPERLALLEADLQGACQVIVDIRSRFLFETRLFERRRSSTVTTRELCELMETAQVDAYGDGLDPAARHPYMWAAKPHYYFSTFYNWPYTFGLLFGLGLYARWRDDPDPFRSGYDDLLSSTGLDMAIDLASRFDIDLHDQDFWQSSLDVVRSRIDDFVASASTFGAPDASPPPTPPTPPTPG